MDIGQAPVDCIWLLGFIDGDEVVSVYGIAPTGRNSCAQADASLPVGADIQTFRPKSIAAFAMAFKRNDFPMIQIMI